ncbi:hypothetical protein SGLAM104S_04327 [Streptomyces glaucescens]
MTTPAADTPIPLRGHLRHTGALIRRNLLWIRQDPESMFDAVLMPIVFTLLFDASAGRSGRRWAADRTSTSSTWCPDCWP